MLARRGILLAAALSAGTLSMGSPAVATSYPDRPVRIVYGYPAGGAGDVIGRLVAERLSATLGQQFIMENRAGAGGTIAASAVARSEPDGYTILLVIESHAINPSLFRSLPYDTAADFAPIGMIGRSPLLLVVNRNVQAANLDEFLALARRTEGGLSMAHFGPGSPQYAAMIMLAQNAGIKFADVPYRGGAPAINDLVGGHMQTFFMTQGSAKPYTVGGQIRAIAAASNAPLPHYPELATLSSKGLNVVAEHWFGFVAPARTPPEVLAKLEAALDGALRAPIVQTRASELGLILSPMGQREFGRFLTEQTGTWADFNRRNNIQQIGQ